MNKQPWIYRYLPYKLRVDLNTFIRKTVCSVHLSYTYFLVFIHWQARYCLASPVTAWPPPPYWEWWQSGPGRCQARATVAQTSSACRIKQSNLIVWMKYSSSATETHIMQHTFELVERDSITCSYFRKYVLQEAFEGCELPGLRLSFSSPAVYTSWPLHVSLSPVPASHVTALQSVLSRICYVETHTQWDILWWILPRWEKRSN